MVLGPLPMLLMPFRNISHTDHSFIFLVFSHYSLFNFSFFSSPWLYVPFVFPQGRAWIHPLLWVLSIFNQNSFQHTSSFIPIASHIPKDNKTVNQRKYEGGKEKWSPYSNTLDNIAVPNYHNKICQKSYIVTKSFILSYQKC